MILVIVLIFPIISDIELLYTGKDSCYFCFSVFGLHVFYGLIKKETASLSIHTNFFHKQLTIKSPYEIKKSIKPLNDYHFIKLNALIDAGQEDEYEATFNTTLILSTLFNGIIDIVKYEKPYLDLNYYVNLYDKNILKVYIRSVIIFNILMIILSLIKILTEKTIYAIRTRKQQN